MPGMPPRKIGHIFQCLSVLLASCPLSLLEKTSHLVCLPGKQASSFQKKASALDQPTGSVLLLTTIVSLKEFSFLIIAFRLSKVPADRIYWLSCSGDTVVEGPKKLGTANLASWYYNQRQRGLSCLNSWDLA